MSFPCRHRRLWTVLWFVATTFAFAGCSNNGDDLPRQPVAGTVLVDGRRLSYGTIMFVPEARPAKGSSVAAGDIVVNGRFSIPRDKGPVPGMYKIAIATEKKRPARTDQEPTPGKAEAAAENQIPARFNTQTVLEIEIKEGGIKELKIEIASK